MTAPHTRRVAHRWRAPARAAFALAAAFALTLLGSGMAQAHVTANATGAAPGGWTVVALRVPTESETASTVKVQVTLPADHPIAEVLTAPTPGWTWHTTKAAVDPPLKTDDGDVSEVVRTITWTAQNGARIAPGQYADFDVSLGPLPEDVSELVLPVTQTYDDGTVVRWDQPRAAGAPEPEHPAPTVTLTPSAGAAAADTAAAPAASGFLGISIRWIALAGLGSGVLALLVAVLGIARTGRTRRQPPPRRMSAGSDELPRQRPGGTGDRRVGTSSAGRRGNS